MRSLPSLTTAGRPPAARPSVVLPDGRVLYRPSTGAGIRATQAEAELELRKRSEQRHGADPLTLRDFFASSWHVVEPGVPYAPNWHLDAICAHLQAVTDGQIRNLIISMPPRSGKSRVVAVAWPAWEWAERDPTKKWLYASYAHTLSKRDSVDCRRLITSPWYQARYRHVFQMSRDQNEKMRFENTRRGIRIATSVGGTTTGEGGDRLVIDDPHNVKQVESKTQREAVTEWHDRAWLSRRNDPNRSTRVIVAQRTHPRDLIGHVLKEDGSSYEHLILPLEYSPRRSRVTVLGWQDPRTERGELLHPERLNATEAASTKRQMGSKAFGAQYNQLPLSEENAIINPAWWQRWRVIPVGIEITHSWDMSFKGAKASGVTSGRSWVVGQVWGRRGADRFLLHQVRGQWGFVDTKKAVKALAALWPRYDYILIEDKANGPAIIDDLRGAVTGLLPMPANGTKVARAEAIAPQVETGNVYLPADGVPGTDWVTDYLEEWEAFGEDADTDDQVDTTTQYLNWARHRSGGDEYESVNV